MQMRCCCSGVRDSAEAPSLSFSAIPQTGGAQAAFDARGQIVALGQVVNFRAVGDVFEDGKRKRIGPLKNHADAFAQLPQIDIAGIDRFAVEQDVSRDLHVRDDLVHPVDDAQQRRFAAPGRPDDRGDGSRANGKTHVDQRVKLPIPEIQTPSSQFSQS